MKTSSKLSIIIVILIAAIALLSVKTCKSIQKEKETLSLIESMNDTIKVWKDKDGLSHSKISALETQNVNDFLKLKSKDEEIIRLQESVREYKSKIKNGGSVTNITSNTNAVIKSPVETTLPPNTVVKPGEKLIYPTYSSKFNLDGWIWGDMTANKDSMTLRPNIKNEYTVVIGEDKTGFLGLGKRKTFVEVKNLNPYTETTSLRTYINTKPKPKLGLGVYTGYGIQLSPKDANITHGVQTGIGLILKF